MLNCQPEFRLLFAFRFNKQLSTLGLFDLIDFAMSSFTQQYVRLGFWETCHLGQT